MTLNETFYLAQQYLANGSLLEASTSVYEAAIPGGWFWMVLLMFIAVLLYLKTQNLGMIGVLTGAVSWFLIEIGKLPDIFQTIPYIIISVSFGLTLYLFYTERNSG